MSGETVGIDYSAFESAELSPLLMPDILMPAQHADLRRTNQRSPEQSLYLSVLHEGIEDWLKGGPAVTNPMTLRHAGMAEHWIWEGGGIVTFIQCCEVAGVLPEWLRSRLESMRCRRPMKLPLIRHEADRTTARSVSSSDGGIGA